MEAAVFSRVVRGALIEKLTFEPGFEGRNTSFMGLSRKSITSRENSKKDPERDP